MSKRKGARRNPDPVSLMLLPGKGAAHSVDEYDPWEIQRGREIEREHIERAIETGDLTPEQIEQITTKISLDHLAEFPDYYTWLDLMEKFLEARAEHFPVRAAANPGWEQILIELAIAMAPMIKRLATKRYYQFMDPNEPIEWKRRLVRRTAFGIPPTGAWGAYLWASNERTDALIHWLMSAEGQQTIQESTSAMGKVARSEAAQELMQAAPQLAAANPRRSGARRAQRRKIARRLGTKMQGKSLKQLQRMLSRRRKK